MQEGSKAKGKNTSQSKLQSQHPMAVDSITFAMEMLENGLQQQDGAGGVDIRQVKLVSALCSAVPKEKLAYMVWRLMEIATIKNKEQQQQQQQQKKQRIGENGVHNGDASIEDDENEELEELEKIVEGLIEGIHQLFKAAVELKEINKVKELVEQLRKQKPGANNSSGGGNSNEGVGAGVGKAIDAEIWIRVMEVVVGVEYIEGVESMEYLGSETAVSVLDGAQVLNIFRDMKGYLETGTQRTKKAAAKGMRRIIREKIVTNYSGNSSANLQAMMTMEQEIGKELEEAMGYQYRNEWKEVFKLIREYMYVGQPLLPQTEPQGVSNEEVKSQKKGLKMVKLSEQKQKIIEHVAAMRGDLNQPFNVQNEVDNMLTASVRALGPRQFLQVLPLNLEAILTKDYSTSRTWELPLMKGGIQGAEIGHFINEMIPRADMMGQQSRELLVLSLSSGQDSGNNSNGKAIQAKVLKTIEMQIWDLFVEYTSNNPVDVEQSVTNEFMQEMIRRIVATPQSIDNNDNNNIINGSDNQSIAMADEETRIKEMIVSGLRGLAKYTKTLMQSQSDNLGTTSNCVNVVVQTAPQLISILFNELNSNDSNNNNNNNNSGINTRTINAELIKETAREYLGLCSEQQVVELYGQLDSMVNNSVSSITNGDKDSNVDQVLVILEVLIIIAPYFNSEIAQQILNKYLVLLSNSDSSSSSNDLFDNQELKRKVYKLITEVIGKLENQPLVIHEVLKSVVISKSNDASNNASRSGGEVSLGLSVNIKDRIKLITKLIEMQIHAYSSFQNLEISTQMNSEAETVTKLLIGETVVYTKNINEKIRVSSLKLLENIAKLTILRFNIVNGSGNGGLKWVIDVVAAGLASQSAVMISATINSITHLLLHYYNAETSENNNSVEGLAYINEIFDTVILFITKDVSSNKKKDGSGNVKNKKNGNKSVGNGNGNGNFDAKNSHEIINKSILNFFKTYSSLIKTQIEKNRLMVMLEFIKTHNYGKGNKYLLVKFIKIFGNDYISPLFIAQNQNQPGSNTQELLSHYRRFYNSVVRLMNPNTNKDADTLELDNLTGGNKNGKKEKRDKRRNAQQNKQMLLDDYISNNTNSNTNNDNGIDDDGDGGMAMDFLSKSAFSRFTTFKNNSNKGLFGNDDDGINIDFKNGKLVVPNEQSPTDNNTGNQNDTKKPFSMSMSMSMSHSTNKQQKAIH
ncbi:Ribosomal RNA-processing protein 12 [Zancudomyces culisetae]|uniref:Ribosomal RNA-processing protein 12 n=1 Tax=Zancudomyces culisetae TaxID=1213189 RepID=A0A1R1PPS9_ZANCU|nr:Ribosomal RNA-processing protein 12 [Zancudomyces culisetae]|eukprot:OMH82967.1 Ribosomal RNA-processing protein 12 [Zancudomyces culisetae]